MAEIDGVVVKQTEAAVTKASEIAKHGDLEADKPELLNHSEQFEGFDAEVPGGREESSEAGRRAAGGCGRGSILVPGLNPCDVIRVVAAGCPFPRCAGGRRGGSCFRGWRRQRRL